ncbi:MAG: GMC family oxidoreductase [Actinomycetota bacterium]|nr:GMC family oxidoreductase [Actinomycetota bacterium]
MLERGTWWTTPVGTVQDKEVKTYGFLKDKRQPVQLWSSAEHFRGFLDLFTRCLRRKGNEDGLYELTNFGRRGLLGLGLRRNDGVTILRASGVGGGSLVYANVTIRPPDEVLEDERWPLSWSAKERADYFELAREAIGKGVGFALYQRDVARDPSKQRPDPPKPVNTGLSNIVTRTARPDPGWIKLDDPLNPRRGLKRIDPAKSTKENDDNASWIARARIFQTEVSKLTDDFGTVDSSINDLPVEPEPYKPEGHPKNYCERQGRCIVGCLPGARHTLNKQLIPAVLGKPDGSPPLFPDLHLEALCEVDVVEALPGGGYRVHYRQRDQEQPGRTTRRSVTAERVIVAAGCVGTNEIMLRSKARGTLPHLSDQLGCGFSTNGDYLAFLNPTKERVSLTRGPVTTSFGHFHSPGSAPNADLSRLHTIEDNGIPRAFSALTGNGMRLLQSLSKGRQHRLFVLFAILRYGLGRIPAFMRALLRNRAVRQEEFASEDEWTDNIMCVAAMGREQSVGRFWLGGRGETTLRLARSDGKAFHEDPIYDEIKATLDALARRLSDKPDAAFVNPFLGPAAEALGARSIGLSHPLGGCRMARSAADGVVDEHGRVFDSSKNGPEPFYEGLYIADAARIPTALAVNPSLTISALALRTADHIIATLPAAKAATAEPAHA